MNTYIGHDFRYAVPDVDHQELIDGLSAMVMRGQISPAEMTLIITHYRLNHPGKGHLDKGILWQIRKELGLEPQGG